MEAQALTAPLAGIRVLDLSRVLAGPWCTQLLADLGADVIKIERPGVGDDTRHWGPPWHGEGERRVAAYFLSANRGKRSAAIDFATEEGAGLVRRLAGQCDVVVENFKAGGLARFGLDAVSLRSANPKLIVASITGFGQDGPYATRAGYDFIIQAMGGMMSVTGHPDGEPGGGPMRAGVAIADLFTGMYACVAILAALHRRETTAGARISNMALFDTQLAMSATRRRTRGSRAMNAAAGQHPPELVPYQPFEAADQPIIIAIGNDRQFARLAGLAVHPEWAGDNRFATNGARVANRGEIVRMVGECIARKPRPNGSRSSIRPEFRLGRSTASARRSPTSGAAPWGWSGRLAECPWSDRRCGSTGRRRFGAAAAAGSASIRARFCASSGCVRTRSTAEQQPGGG